MDGLMEAASSYGGTISQRDETSSSLSRLFSLIRFRVEAMI